MQRLSTTPFGRRPVSAGLLATRRMAEAPCPTVRVDKWQVLRDLTTARAHFSLSSQTLAVLQALLSFHPGQHLASDAPIIVFPSNRALGERAHGKSEATLRRHLAALSEAGLILRHDSPNGKRYAARDGAGQISAAFGFDLRPLLVRAGEIAEAAENARQVAEGLRRLREATVLALRDATKMLLLAQMQGADARDAVADRLERIRGALRRRLDPAALAALQAEADALRRSLEARIADASPTETAETSAHADHSDCHYQISKPETCEVEAWVAASDPQQRQPDRDEQDRREPVTLDIIRRACPALSVYSGERLDDWNTLVRSAETVRSWIGIGDPVWTEAVAAMGRHAAAACIAGILERRSEIRSPAAYLRRLSEKARKGAFTPGPMIRALLTRAAAAPAPS